jgi:hypothetical protein
MIASVILEVIVESSLFNCNLIVQKKGYTTHNFLPSRMINDMQICGIFGVVFPNYMY